MPRKSRNCRSKRRSLTLTLAIVCAVASQGCKSGIPQAPNWSPTRAHISAKPIADSPVAFESPVDDSFGIDSTANIKVSSESSLESHLSADAAKGGVVQFAADNLADSASSFATASLLRSADPYQLQPPEAIDAPLPKEGPKVDPSNDENSPEAGRQAGNSEAGDQGDSTDDKVQRDQDEEPDEKADSDVPPLYLDDVVASVRNQYPKIREAIARQAEASGQILSAWGNFDTVLDGQSMNQPLGFYENYRHSIGLKKPLWNGGYAGVGYRLGDGDFEPWYGERETDEGGEFKIGFDVPVLQNRAIDKRRAALRAAELRRGQTDPELFYEILMAQGDAAFAYWTWVAAGLNVEIQSELLKLAEDRVEQLEREIELGNIPEFRKIDNDRLIAARQIKLIDAERKFGQSAVKLSMYLRDANGMPLLPPPNAVPDEFPPIPEVPIDDIQLVNAAVSARPETRILQFDAATLRVELAQANNQLLPELNIVMETSQDVGGKTSSKGDKQPAKIEAGFYGEVPLQRRAARGKIDSLSAKLRQIEAKLQLASDRIATEVQQVLVAREAALRQIEQAEVNQRLARETLRIGDIALRGGEFTLPILNIYEQAVADAEAAMLVAKSDFFIADALLRIAIGSELDVREGVIPPAVASPLSQEER